ncbi:membrane protein [Luteitalea sp. TBR-22]|uniref:DUF2752 domain-containing protein n=1 Tax=Luteitalea sp. TBR-22 TaxID=2802971 RepID=UPI001AF35C00|nr:DUF2752 domain-containing protein [Luteitalea sp. TBR-22]BCS34274.1 membrane protein [Luteitalea sp. TBR-22]
MAVRRTPGTVAAAIVLLLSATAVLYAVDPTQHRLTLPCPYLTLTGYACPGCGLTRSLHFLLHGDLARAFSFNPWGLVSGPALLLFVFLPAVTDEVRASRWRTALAWTMLVVTLAFWVWRNTTAYPFVRV